MLINAHLPSGHVHTYQLEESISNLRGVWCTFSLLFYFEWIFLLANSEDPDQTPHNAASDLGLNSPGTCHNISAIGGWERGVALMGK